MALPTFNPPVPPSETTVRSVKPKILETQFGDGYTQRTADGLNHIKREVRAVWLNVHALNADAIEAFLEARGGYEPFYWTAPDDDTQRRWACKTWDRQFHPNKRRTLTATFTQDFSLEQ